MPVRSILKPLGITTTDDRCGDCPHARKMHPYDHYESGERRFCVEFNEWMETDDDGPPRYGLNPHRLEECQKKEHGREP